MLPDMSDVLTEWEQSVILKTVTRTTVDFVDQIVITPKPLRAVVQVADKERLNPDEIDWSLRYILIHSKQPMQLGQYVEYQGTDYKLTQGDANYQDYGYTELVGEEVKGAIN